MECPNAGLHLRLQHLGRANTLFVAVNEIEPNPRLALALKFLIVFCERCGSRRKTDALTAVGLRRVCIDQFLTKYAGPYCPRSERDFWGYRPLDRQS
jgi:hypothetical protein